MSIFRLEIFKNIVWIPLISSDLWFVTLQDFSSEWHHYEKIMKYILSGTKCPIFVIPYSLNYQSVVTMHMAPSEKLKLVEFKYYKVKINTCSRLQIHAYILKRGKSK